MDYGLWSKPEVPHKGWRCTDVEDLGAPAETCEMCQSQTIRYVHVMEHDRHEPLRVGCVCAGKMEGDLAGARAREGLLMKKVRFARSKVWKSVTGKLVSFAYFPLQTFVRVEKVGQSWLLSVRDKTGRVTHTSVWSSELGAKGRAYEGWLRLKGL